jgi:hypothetical protein
MRVVTVPNTLNGQTGLICSHVGDRKELDKRTIQELLIKSREFAKFHGYPEPLESSRAKLGSNGAMKTCAKNLAEATVRG